LAIKNDDGGARSEQNDSEDEPPDREFPRHRMIVSRLRDGGKSSRI
jgi:hypothetical protein